MLVLLASFVLVAEPDPTADENLFELENEMVTAASRTSEPVRKAPASVTVVTERELRAFDYVNVADALQGVRGLYETDDKFYTSLGVRGFNRFGDYGNRLQVQMDGHVMNDDWIFSSYIGNDQFSDISHVDGIEVVRGPGSALYGTGAFFGVVNLVTPKKAPDYDVRLGAGVIDTNTLRVHADGGHQFAGGPGFWLSAGASTLPPQDYFAPAYVGTPWAPDGIAHGVDTFNNGTVEGKGWWGDFTLQLSLNARSRRIPTGAFGDAFGDIRAEGDDRRGFVELRYEPKLNEWAQLLTRVYVDNQSYVGHYPGQDPSTLVGGETFDSTWAGVEARGVLTPWGPDLRLTTGAQVEAHPFNRWIGFDRPDVEPYLDQSLVFEYLSAYALADWDLLPSTLLLTGGARFDGWFYNSATAYGQQGAVPGAEFLWSLNPRVAAIWTPDDDDTLKLMGGRSYRVPSNYELTYSVVGQSATGTPLDSESIYTAELEYRRRLPLDVVAIGSVYTNVVTDLINYITSIDNVEGYNNVPDPITTVGAEAEIRYDLPAGMLAAVQYSFQQTRAGLPWDGDLVSNSPTHLAAAWLVTPIAPSLSVANRVVFEAGRLDRELQPLDPSLLWDIMLTGDFASSTGLPVGFTVGLKNALDSRVEHPVSDRVLDVRILQPGRTLRAEINGRF